jgi:hypothetical protein
MRGSRANEPAAEITAGEEQMRSAAATLAVGPLADRLTPDRAVQLQRLIGNRAVAKRATRRDDRRTLQRDYVDPGVKAVADANPKLTADQRGGLDMLDQQHGMIDQAWSKLSWDDVSAGAAQRIATPSIVNQGNLGLCGPAAILNWMAECEPGTYAYMVATVYELGGISDKKKCNDTLLGTTCQPGMNPVDWMMMSAMQDLSNDILSYYGRPSKLPRDGTIDSGTAWILEAFTKVQKTSSLWCKMTGVKERTAIASDLLRTYGDKVCVLMDVDSTTLQNETGRGSEDHVIRLLKPITWNDATIDFEVFSWGRYWKKSFKTENFEHMCDGYLIGATDASINL